MKERLNKSAIVILCVALAVSPCTAGATDGAAPSAAGSGLRTVTVVEPTLLSGWPLAHSEDATSDADLTVNDEEASGSAEPAPSAEPASGPSGASPNMWIWQGSDQQPVKVKTKRTQRRTFDVTSQKGFGLKIQGQAGLGYTSQSQTAAPGYSTLTNSLDASASGFLYNPRLAAFTLSTAYDREGFAVGARDNVLNGLSYGASLSLLSASPVPVTVSFTRMLQNSDGSLSTPFDTNRRGIDITGNVLHLPVALSYRYGFGNSNTNVQDGRFLKYDYKTAGVSLSRSWEGITFRVGDDYLRSRTDYDQVDSPQTTNYLRATADRNFGERVTAYVEGIWSKYDFARTGVMATNADITSVSVGARWAVSPKFDTSVTASVSRNAVNLLQLVSQTSGSVLPNPLPGVSALDTSSRTISGVANYRPATRWNFSGAVNYSNFDLPPATASTLPTNSQQLTNGALGFTGSAAYERPIRSIEYSGGVTATVQHLNFAFNNGQTGLTKGYSITNGISGGGEEILRWNARFTVSRTNNPVFFDLLTSSERSLELGFVSRHFPIFKITGTLDYRQRRIHYAGSDQDQNGLNFLVTATRSKWDLSAGRLTTDANSRLFNLLSNSTGSAPPIALLGPSVFSRSVATTLSATWRARRNLELDSRYSRFSFGLFSDANSENRQTQIDNYALYHLGRFDIVGGFVYFNGFTGTYQRRVNLYYFRLKFPFQLW